MTFTSHAADLDAPRDFPWIAHGLAFGADYSPEQWPEEVWADDIALMREAGVTTVSLGIFSWGLLEVDDGVFEWGWLDRIMNLLADAGIGVNLATPTAAPPTWLLQQHPEIATVDSRGYRAAQGGRLAWSPSSSTFRRYALRMVRAMAERYGEHPALRLWHVSNEIGNENARCFSEESTAAWQHWLEQKFGSIEALNIAWGTAFWGHHYREFSHVQPPRQTTTGHNPGLLLDWERFSSDALLGHFIAERDLLRSITPGVPVTTNFMVQRGPGAADYERWSLEVDLVANDHYTLGADAQRHRELAFSADRTRGMAQGRPWLLMEHSTAAVNWQPINRAKSAGELARNSLAHIARGADGVMFFQWRQSTAGSEQFHSAMVPHAGRDSQVFRDVVDLGAAVAALAAVRGTRVEQARVALLFDTDSVFALRSGPKPRAALSATELSIALHAALTDRGIAVDVVPSSSRLDGYDTVIVPMLFLATPLAVESIEGVVARGGHVLITYFSGIVDDTNRVHNGAYPGAFRELLGIRVDEFFPLLDGDTVDVDAGWSASRWTERVELAGAEALARSTSGQLAGTPVFTRRWHGSGSASYLAVHPDERGVRAVIDDLIATSGLEPVAIVDEGIEATRRVGDSGSFLFLINHTAAQRMARAKGRDLLSGRAVDGEVRVPPGAVMVVEEEQ